MIFTLEELHQYTMPKLRKLAEYYKINHADVGKEELIQKLYDVLVTLTNDGLPITLAEEAMRRGMSVRALRIKKLKEGTNVQN